jgi:DNA polymerase III subunit delta'
MKFKLVPGQDDLKHRLIDQVRSGRIAHANLFLGKTGYGSLPLALAFAQYIFCENKGEQDSCGTCPSCRKVEKLEHPDLHFSYPTVQGSAKTSIEQVQYWRESVLEDPFLNNHQWSAKSDKRKGQTKAIISVHESHDIIRRLSLRSFEGGYKIMIIWKADEMNTQAANKLLKILEEPTAKTIFILLSEDEDRMLMTIRSRTQIIRIPGIEDGALIDFLTQRHGIGRTAAENCVARAQGSVSVADELLSAEDGSGINRELFIQLMRSCYKKNVLEMQQWAENISKQPKVVQADFILYAIHMFRQSLLRNYTGEQLTRVTKEEDEFLSNFSRFITGNNIHDFLDKFSKGHYHLERHASSEILFTDLCFDVMRCIHAA